MSNTNTTTPTRTRKPAARKTAAKATKPAPAKRTPRKPAAKTTTKATPTTTTLVPGTDAHVIQFVTAQRASNPRVGVAAMLKAYRTSGARCAQERFRAIAATLAAKAAS